MSNMRFLSLASALNQSTAYLSFAHSMNTAEQFMIDYSGLAGCGKGAIF